MACAFWCIVFTVCWYIFFTICLYFFSLIWFYVLLQEHIWFIHCQCLYLTLCSDDCVYSKALLKVSYFLRSLLGSNLKNDLRLRGGFCLSLMAYLTEIAWCSPSVVKVNIGTSLYNNYEISTWNANPKKLELVLRFRETFVYLERLDAIITKT